jgi:hypothetical protein
MCWIGLTQPPAWVSARQNNCAADLTTYLIAANRCEPDAGMGGLTRWALGGTSGTTVAGLRNSGPK